MEYKDEQDVVSAIKRLKDKARAANRDGFLPDEALACLLFSLNEAITEIDHAWLNASSAFDAGLEAYFDKKVYEADQDMSLKDNKEVCHEAQY